MREDTGIVELDINGIDSNSEPVRILGVKHEKGMILLFVNPDKLKDVKTGGAVKVINYKDSFFLDKLNTEAAA